MYIINLVEDEKNLNDLLCYYLQKEGWKVNTYFNGIDAKEAICEDVDLWVLDIMLPGGMDGYELIKHIKKHSPEVPVIFISARDRDIDRVVGLEVGSDDYIIKPFLPRELVIRVSKQLKRVYGSNKTQKFKKTLNGIYTIDSSKREIIKNNNPIDITSKEFDFVKVITSSSGKVYSREELLNSVWGNDYFGTDRVVDDLVRRIRKKMPKLKIETVYGFGYRWCQNEK